MLVACRREFRFPTVGRGIRKRLVGSAHPSESRFGEGSLSRVLFACLIAPTEGFKARSSAVLIVVGRVLEYELSYFSDVRSNLGDIFFDFRSKRGDICFEFGSEIGDFCSHEGNIFFDFRS